MVDGKLIIAIVVFLGSCKNQNENVKTERYSNGNLKFIKNYKNGLIDGQSQWFYPSGTIEQIVLFKNGKENGNAYYFYKSGTLKSFRYWREGNMVGYVSDYYDDTVVIIKSVLIYSNKGKLIYRKNFDSIGRFINEEGKKPIPSQ